MKAIMQFKKWRAAGAVGPLAIVLSACGGGGGSGDSNAGAVCNSFAGQAWDASASMNPANCGMFSDGQAVADGALGTAASASMPSGCTETVMASASSSNFGTVYAAGAKLGAFITRSANIDASMITVTATLQGNPVQTATGPTLDFLDTAGHTSAEEYVFLTANQPFDGVSLTIAVPAPSAAAGVRVFELCSDGGLR